MSEYSRAVLKVVVAQICQTIGWHSVNSTPLEFMVDLMQEYMLRISRLAHQYAETLGRTDVNLDDVGLAFHHMNIDVQQLAEYVKNVDSVACAISVPKIPIHQNNHLNFLKPGSREVVTRPVHVHEHLPAMFTDTEEVSPVIQEECFDNVVIESDENITAPTENQGNLSPNHLTTENVFKRPGDPLSDNIVKRSKITDESRPLREIHSVMMTTSGFLSPAREGKLPEARTPAQTRTEFTPRPYPADSPEIKTEKKVKKVVKKSGGVEERKIDKENKKKNRDKDLFKPDKVNETKVKKLAGMKELSKLKPLKTGGIKSSVIAPSSSANTVTQHIGNKDDVICTTPKSLSPKMKIAKPINNQLSVSSDKKDMNISKLPVEPDKQKLNIFKKISKPREDKNLDVPDHHKFRDNMSRESSPGLIIDEPPSDSNKRYDSMRTDADIKRDEKKTPHTPEAIIETEHIRSRSPGSDVYMFDDMSPPGTPSTPKTPELSVPGVVTEPKKRKKDKSSRKKDNLKVLTLEETPQKDKHTDVTEILGKPKTPEALESSSLKDTSLPSTLPFPFFPPFPPAPGLIPHPMSHPMFPRFPLPRLPCGAVQPPIPIRHNIPLPSRFLRPNMKPDDGLLMRQKMFDREPSSDAPNSVDHVFKSDIDEMGKSNKFRKHDPTHTVNTSDVPGPSADRFDTISAGGSAVQQTSHKADKLERIDKKSKKHKIERKDKVKKKKEKKDKHKEKTEKSKEKKDKLEKLKDKRERKEKKKDKKEDKGNEAVPKITLKLGTTSPRPATPETAPMKKITIKTVLKKSEEVVKRESSPELAKISALVTRPPKQKAAKFKPDPVAKKSEIKEDKISDKPVVDPLSSVVDQGGNQIWICPACGNQDDGSPMVGCDDCDAWYHWVCVGMQVPPATNENWYCPFCIAKQQELHHDKKKKKRKKKVKIAV